MSGPIRSEHVLEAAASPASGTTSAAVLVGEIEGLRTVFHAVAPGATLSPEHGEAEGRVYLFTSGQGWIEASDSPDATADAVNSGGGDSGVSGSGTRGVAAGGSDSGSSPLTIAEVAFYAPRHDTDFIIHAEPAAPEPLRVLELIIDLSPTDLDELALVADRYPLFLSYSDCKTYRERIKSEKTTSRTLLPEHTFPRLCIGSVETTGDDRVAAHEHPMLEQLFFGLADNDCVVRADEAEFSFGEGVLLHIPLGSSHGVEVHAPKKLHYIWIDLFRDRQGMDWIVQEHITDP